MKIIVNADDFGHGETKTAGILEAWRRGVITRTTAMANMPWFEKAMNAAKQDGALIKSVGLHFNLTEGVPLTEEMRSCRALCDEHGVYAPAWHSCLKTRLVLPRTAGRAIAAEAKAQIERYLDCGGVMMHLDSHHHSHTDFSVARVLFPIAKKYGFRTVRMSQTIAVNGGAAKRIYKLVYNFWAGRCFKVVTDHFGSFEGFDSERNKLSSSDVVEIMEHPEFKREGNPDMTGELCDTDRPMEGDVRYWEEMGRRGIVLERGL